MPKRRNSFWQGNTAQLEGLRPDAQRFFHELRNIAEGVMILIRAPDLVALRQHVEIRRCAMMSERHEEQVEDAVGRPAVERVQPGGVTEAVAVDYISCLRDMAGPRAGFARTALKAAIGLAEVV